MKLRIAFVVLTFAFANAGVSQENFLGSGSSADPALGNRVTVPSRGAPNNNSKTEAEVDSQVVRYLAVQLTDSSFSNDLIAFLGLESDQVEDILEIVKSIDEHYLRQEIQRMSALCGRWFASKNTESVETRLGAALEAYEQKLNEQRSEPPGLYRSAMSRIAAIVGTGNQDAWEEYVRLQRVMMFRSETTYFHQNVFSSPNPIASVEANCGGN